MLCKLKLILLVIILRQSRQFRILNDRKSKDDDTRRLYLSLGMFAYILVYIELKIIEILLMIKFSNDSHPFMKNAQLA